MSDGRIEINVKANDSDLDRLNGKLKGVEGDSKGAISGIKNIAVSLGLVKIASAAFDVLKNAMGSAISRFDTFNTFPKVMDALGFSAEESSDAINKLSDGIDGLPTKLDDVVNTTKRMTSVTGNLDESTDATIALNNAMLASGASTADASRGMDQYIQMLSTGKVDMTSWRTLQETMPIGLQKTAEAMGYVGESAQNDLYAALKDGEITFKDFQKQLIELGTGTGELAELAKVNSENMATSFSNLANTASKGLANLLTALDKAVEEATGKNIAQQVDGLKVIINAAFKAMGKAIEMTVPIIKLFVTTLTTTVAVGKALSPILIGLAASYTALKVIQTVNGYITKQKEILDIAKNSSEKLTVATKGQKKELLKSVAASKLEVATNKTKLSTLLATELATKAEVATLRSKLAAQVASGTATKAEIADTKAKIVAATASNASAKAEVLTMEGKIAAQTVSIAATEADTTAKLANNGAVKLSTILTGLMTGSLSASAAASAIASTATTAFSAAVKIALGPIGLAVAAIGLLVTATAAVVKWFKKASDETEELRKEQENLVSSAEEVTSTTKDNIKARDSEIKSIDTNAKAYSKLADELDMLVNTEGKSAGEKKLLKDTVDQLNGSVADLNLVYDEESDKLSLSAELIKARIEAQKEQETANVAQEHLTELIKEQIAAEGELEAVAEKRREWNEVVEEGTGKFLEDAKIKRDAKVANEELDATEEALTQTITDLGVQQEHTRGIMESANAAVAQATEDGVNRQVISYEGLSEKQREVVDMMNEKWNEYSQHTTEMFSTISDEQTLSVNEMLANMEENQRVMGTMWENIATLTERGLSEGIIQQLQEAGPDAAGHVAALVTASDEEIAKMNEGWGTGVKMATDKAVEGVDFGSEELAGKVRGMVGKSGDAFKAAVAEADFKTLGKNVAEGAAKGIDNGSKEAETASKNMGKNVSKGFATELGIQSPSRKFKEFGGFIAKGLQQGITQGVPLVTNAMSRLQQQVINGMTKTITVTKKMATRIPRQFDGLNGQMSDIGRNIMYGLSSGIWAGSGSAISAAQSVASRVKSTIQSAMKIHSPSRWMRDFIGKNMMEGWGIGLEKYANMPESSMISVIDQMKDSMLTADMALNVNGGLGVAGMTTNNYNSTTNQNGSYGSITVEVPLILEGREIARVATPFIDKEINRIRRSEARRRGDI